MSSPKHIAVVGAGIAGLSCATLLQQAGFQVSIFDKSRGSAGRMSTRRGEDWECDHGAQYFTARDPNFRNEVARWQQAGVADLWQRRIKVFDGTRLEDRESNLARFVGVPRMTAPAHFLADAFNVVSDTLIDSLHPQADGWSLGAAQQQILNQRFDAVLLAIPAPQAVPLLRDVAVDLSNVAASARMRGAWALMLRYADQPELPFDAVFVNHGPLRWVARNNSKPGRSGAHTWLLHASPAWSEEHIEDEADTVAAVMLDAFAQLGAPPPQAWTAHRWRYADSDPALDLGCVWESQLGIGLCGDWLNGGKVEGAWLSGRALAQRIVEL
ncbi:MAG: NAD(P)-binding protein [Rhodocyclaceae bacterium]|nr:NAD(P)-binding protein [Rhodocyclaceae bacterium]MBK9623609.1 NAD(P)-binding protein [Rhodocyclaceae bacterium]MBP6108958.1 NAD(P)-binding protein [Rhodocyclaceae bacterium]